jgi:hypothetical protein
MPFTLSHAAAVLPALRRDGGGARGPLVACALVAGSFAPDVPYFAASVLPGGMELGDLTHGTLGVLTVDALLTGLLVGLWLLMREPLIALLVPAARQARVYALLAGHAWRGRRMLPLLAACYVSAVLGSGSHVVWDAFTHPDRWGMRHFPVLGEEFGGSPLYWYVQYGSSAVALVVLGRFLAGAVRGLPDGVPPVEVPLLGGRERVLALAGIGTVVAAATVHRCVGWWAAHGTYAKAYEIIPTICFGAGAGLAVSLPLYAALVRLRTRAAPVPAPEKSRV